MKIRVQCPCGCGHWFDVEVTRETTEEVAKQRRERIKAIREANREKLGRPFGAKDSVTRKVRIDKGIKRGPRGPIGKRKVIPDFDDVSRFDIDNTEGSVNSPSIDVTEGNIVTEDNTEG